MTQIDRSRGLVGALGIKAPCVAATTAAITLSAVQTIDGVSVIAEDRVLVKNQSSSVDNGIYICQAAAWIRAPDFDGARDVLQGTLVPVYGGTVNAKSVWELTTANTITIATSSLTFVSWLAHNVQTLTDGATVAWDISSGDSALLTLGGNRTLSAPTNAKDGEMYTLVVTQDATGSRTITWNSVFKWPWNGLAPVLSTAASAKDIFVFWHYNSVFYGVGPQKRFA